MDPRLPPPDDPRRVAVRRAVERDPSPAALAEAGLVAPGWPRPWGIDADPEHRLAIALEFEALGVDPHAHNPIGIGWAGPTILAAGTDAQRERYLWPLLTGEEVWCQLFSEPGSGSDLASLTTSAVRTGDSWVVDGRKVWNTYADRAAMGILLARTNRTVPRHRGISFFLCPMGTPGIEVHPIRQMTGEFGFCEVSFDSVRLADDAIVGEVDGGWALAGLTLVNERLSLSSGGVLWGRGPRTSDLIDMVAGSGDRELADRTVALYAEAEIMRLLDLRLVTTLTSGGMPGVEVAIRKYLADRHGRRVMELAKEFAGAEGMVADAGEWHQGYLFSPALTIGGGTTQVLADLIAERLLGLPRMPAPA